jgi:hypothetical protein
MKFKVGDRVIFRGFDVIPDTKGKYRGCIQKCRSTFYVVDKGREKWSCEEYLVRFNNQESWLDKDALEIDQQWIRDEKINQLLR